MTRRINAILRYFAAFWTDFLPVSRRELSSHVSRKTRHVEVIAQCDPRELAPHRSAQMGPV